LLIIPWTARFP